MLGELTGSNKKLLVDTVNVPESRWKDNKGEQIKADEIEQLIETSDELNETFGDNLTARGIAAIQKLDPDAYLANFDDQFKDSELVYGIAVNRRVKRVTVVFRGSVELNDWLHNITLAFEEIKFKERILEGTTKSEYGLIESATYKFIEIDDYISYKELQKQKIQVHKGFLSYLFKLQAKDQMSKYEAIVRRLEAIYLTSGHQKLDLYVTGHSLGGALCTLLAFLLSCDKRVQSYIDRSKTRRVNCISFASPSVGDKGWGEAFKIQEKTGYLRHIRVTNENDLVPLGFPPFMFLTGPWYVHTGINLHLRPKPLLCQATPDISYRGMNVFKGKSLVWQLISTCPLLAVPVLSFPWLPAVILIRFLVLWMLPWLSSVSTPHMLEAFLDILEEWKWTLSAVLLALQVVRIRTSKRVLSFVTHGLGDYLDRLELIKEQLGSKSVDYVYKEHHPADLLVKTVVLR
eukprot:scaffold553883_cov122-Attheya_sp.AAC.2